VKGFLSGKRLLGVSLLVTPTTPSRMHPYKIILTLLFVSLCLSPMMANVSSSPAYTLVPTEQVHTDPPQKDQETIRKKKQARAQKTASAGAVASIVSVIGIKICNVVKFFSPDTEDAK
jgi:hypothetical protein